MERIMIIGCSGCGKTTLAKRLADKLHLPLIHLDVLNWGDDWNPVPKEEFEALLSAEVVKPEWIIDGNYNRTIPLRLQYCDTVIYMDFSRVKCIYGVLKRVIKGYGKSRSDMGGNCPERFDFEFLKFVWNFNKKNRKRYYEMLEAQKTAQVIVLKNRRQAARFLQNIGSLCG